MREFLVITPNIRVDWVILPLKKIKKGKIVNAKIMLSLTVKVWS